MHASCHGSSLAGRHGGSNGSQEVFLHETHFPPFGQTANLIFFLSRGHSAEDAKILCPCPVIITYHICTPSEKFMQVMDFPARRGFTHSFYEKYAGPLSCRWYNQAWAHPSKLVDPIALTVLPSPRPSISSQPYRLKETQGRDDGGRENRSTPPPGNTYQVEEIEYAPVCLHAYPILYGLYRDFYLFPPTNLKRRCYSRTRVPSLTLVMLHPAGIPSTKANHRRFGRA